MSSSPPALPREDASNPYLIEWVRFGSGERLPLLVSRDTGLPIEGPAYWVTSCERPLNKASATLEKRLRHLMLLYLWGDARGRAPEELVRSPGFLTLEQLNDLDRFCRQPLLKAVLAFRRSQGASGTVVRLPGRKRTNPDKPVPRADVGNRLSAIHAYLEHLSFAHASRLEPGSDARRTYEESRTEVLRLLQARSRAFMPSRDSGPPAEGLHPEMRQAVLAAIEPGRAANPWEPRVQQRNALVVRLLFDLGMRAGESLCLRVGDLTLTPSGGLLRIVRRPQDPEDPRQPKPQVKTLGRELPLGPTLRGMLLDYLKERRRLPAARRHPFLFVSTDDGAPLSVSSMTKIFRAFRERVPGLPADLSAHVLRHDWNDRFSEMSDEASPNRDSRAAAKEERARAYAQGWSNPATAARYTKRWTKEAAAKRSLKMQEKTEILVERTDERRTRPDSWDQEAEE